jgi:hypothetical protein
MTNVDREKADKTLDALQERLAVLREAESLLLKLYVEVGPYRSQPISDDIWGKIGRHFHFDDSE